MCVSVCSVSVSVCDACLYSVCRERPARAKTAIDILLPSSVSKGLVIGC